MELFERAVEPVSHTVYVGDEIMEPSSDVLAVVMDPIVNGRMPYQASGEAGEYTVFLGQAVTGNFRPKTLHWEYTLDLPDGTEETVVTQPEELEVIRPYISIHEYNRNIPPGDALLFSDFRRLESVARKVIESYTRQSFQLKRSKTYTITGGGTNSLQLPDRLVGLTDISTIDPYIGARVETYSLMDYVLFDNSNPWQLTARYSDSGLDPVYDTHFFKNGTTYTVAGDWGWTTVPADVKEATGILIRDYMDDDALYREKYITVIRAADWRMEFGATGMETTGNANADFMLEKYRNYRPEVI